MSVVLVPMAQATSEVGTYDTTHLIPPIYARDLLSSTSDVQNHYLYLSTNETTAFDVTIQNADGFNSLPGGISQTVSISKTSPQLITLSAAPYGATAYGALGIVADVGLNVVNSTDGLILTAPNRFYANIRHLSGSQGTSLTAKGQTAFGKRFRSGHLHTNATDVPEVKSHFISLMAVEDGTTVSFGDITPGLTFVGGSTSPGPVILDKYESYTIGVRLDQYNNTVGTAENDLNGTLVTSDKPIVMNSGSFLAGAQGGGRDIGTDQILSTGFLGTKFIVVEGAGGAAADVLETPIVIAEYDNTEIFLRGSATPYDLGGGNTVLNAGEYAIIPGTEYPAEGVMFIRTSQPAYLYQSTSSNSSNGNGMNYVAPIFDNLETQPVLIPAVDQLGTPTISVIAPATATITLNGAVMTGATAVPGISEFVLYTDTDETGDVEITGTEPFLVTTSSNSGNRGAAGYFVGFPNSYAIQDQSSTPPGLPVTIDVQLNDVPGVFVFTVTSVTQPANGAVVLNGNGTVTYTPVDSAFTGVDTFTYTIDNGSGLTDSAIVTVSIDSDSDGIGNTTDLDSDNDGIPDSIEGVGDTDGDLIPDNLDLDSDNDGIYDVEEARHGAIDANNDGRVDGFTGDNGLLDSLETVAESNILNYTVDNFDSDGVANYLDLDSDNDGLPDNIEAQDGVNYIEPGLVYDLNGVDTVYPTGLRPYNTTGTGNPDYLNTDSDQDGDSDTLESGLTLSGVPGANGLDSNYETDDDYTDPNGTIGDPSTFPDSDADGIPDYQDNNLPSTDLAIDGGNTDTVDENVVIGTVVGALATTDPDLGDTFTYSLTCAPAGADDAIFRVNGTNLETNALLDYENPTDANFDRVYEVCIISNDGYHDYQETITITLSDLDEIAPAPPVITTPIEGDDVVDETEHNSVLVEGTAEANSTVEVTFSDGVNPDVIVTVVTNGGGNWTLLGNEADISLLSEGNITVTATSMDAAGNTSLPVSETIDHQAIEVDVTVGDTTATVTWTTPTATSSQVDYGLTTTLNESTGEQNIAPKVTSHTLDLTGLLSCTTYFYETISRDAGGNVNRDGIYEFTTTGCVGGTTVSAGQTTNVVPDITGDNGTPLSLTAIGADRVDLSIPAGYATTAACGAGGAYFQLKQLVEPPVITALGLPTDVLNLNTINIYELSAYCDPATRVTTFDQPITVTMYYDALEVANLDESAIRIYRYNTLTPAWEVLNNCSVNMENNTVTCETVGFSSFGVFGPNSGGGAGVGGGSANKRFIVDVCDYETGKCLSVYPTGSDTAYQDYLACYQTNASKSGHQCAMEWALEKGYVAAIDFNPALVKATINSADTTESPEILQLSAPAACTTEQLVRYPDRRGSGMPADIYETDTNNPAYEYALDLAEQGVVHGDDTSGGLRINDLITRAEAVKVFSQAAEHLVAVEIECLDNYFPDVETGAWYHRYVQNMQERDIVHGYKDGFYKPQRNISAGELYKIASITFGYATKAQSDRSLLDWHEFYRKSLLKNGVLPTWILEYEPDQPVTRGDLFSLISKILMVKDGIR